MIVVLDTNIFVADFRFTGNSHRIFFDAFDSIDLKLYMPQIVFDEIVNTYLRAHADLSTQFAKVNKEYRKLFGTNIPNNQINTNSNEIESLFASYLKNKLGEINATFVDYPKVSHAEIVERELKRRKPYKQNGSGYRDTLIWYSLISIISKASEQVAFVTMNKTDFGDLALFDDLVSDLKKRKIDPNRLLYYSSLDDFNESQISPKLREIEGIRKELEQGKHKFSIRKWISKSLSAELNDSEFLDQMSPVDPKHASVYIYKISEIISLKIENAKTMNSSQLYIVAVVEVNVQLSISANYEQFLAHEDVRNQFGDDDEPFLSVAMEWPEGCEVKFSLILSDDQSSPASCQIESVLSNGFVYAAKSKMASE